MLVRALRPLSSARPLTLALPNMATMMAAPSSTTTTASTTSTSTTSSNWSMSQPNRGFKIRIVGKRDAPKRHRLPTPRQIRAAAARMNDVPATPYQSKVVADASLNPPITHPVIDIAQNEIGRV
jgi:hypothetical protein